MSTQVWAWHPTMNQINHIKEKDSGVCFEQVSTTQNNKHKFKGKICGLSSILVFIISPLIFFTPWHDMISFDTLEDGLGFLLVVMPLILVSVGLTGIILGILAIYYEAYISGVIGVVLNSIVLVFSLLFPLLAMG